MTVKSYLYNEYHFLLSSESVLSPIYFYPSLGTCYYTPRAENISLQDFFPRVTVSLYILYAVSMQEPFLKTAILIT